MKRCPTCNIEYFDLSLEFCLEDGTRLVSSGSQEVKRSSITSPNKSNPLTEKTHILPFSSSAQTQKISDSRIIQPTSQTELINVNVAQQSLKILEIAPLTIALLHNWWQWIYLNNQYYSSFTNYVFSGNFLMWLFLLLVGAITGLIAVKRCRNKGFVFAGLVILSINLILFLVPKR